MVLITYRDKQLLFVDYRDHVHACTQDVQGGIAVKNDICTEARRKLRNPPPWNHREVAGLQQDAQVHAQEEKMHLLPFYLREYPLTGKNNFASVPPDLLHELSLLLVCNRPKAGKLEESRTSTKESIRTTASNGVKSG